MRKFWQTTWQCAAVFLCIVSGIIVASLGPSNQAAPGWLLLHDLYYPWVYLAVFYGLLADKLALHLALSPACDLGDRRQSSRHLGLGHLAVDPGAFHCRARFQLL